MTFVTAARLQRSLRPPLKWAGGKRWLVPHMKPMWEPYRHRRYVELFCGGLALPLGLMPERAFLSDLNPHLINFYRWLQRGLQIDLDMQNDSALYYAHRDHFNRLIDQGQHTSRTAAQLFYFLNRTGFNGLCRFNRRGEFNVPFGRYRSIRYIRDFSPYAPVLGKWHFSHGDFEQYHFDDEDFIYADPPYDVEFVSYSKEGFSWADQVRLAEWLARHRGPTVISNQATERIIALYERLGFTILYFTAPRRISSSGDRTPALEVLAYRNL